MLVQFLNNINFAIFFSQQLQPEITRRCSSLAELLCLYFYLTRAMFPAPNFEKCPQKKPAAKPITAHKKETCAHARCSKFAH